MKKTDIMKIPNSEFGLPREKKFPMHDEPHLKAAIAYFHTAAKEKRAELAKNIVKRYNDLKSTLKVSKKNPLYKFVPDSMRNVQEADGLFENVGMSSVNPALMGSLFGSQAQRYTESLMEKKGLNTVDDLDSQIPDDYRKKKLLLGTLKSCILNEESMSSHPLVYMDYPVLKESLSKNNGGINKLTESTSIILDYNQNLNESVYMNTVNNHEHIQFCAILREWDEGYRNGIRNRTYDRLMIESWKTRVSQIQEDDERIGADNHAHAENLQKAIDMGITSKDDMDLSYDPEEDNAPVEKAAEIGFGITQDMADRYYEHKTDNPDLVSTDLSVEMYTDHDRDYVPQKGADIKHAQVWRLR